MPDAELAGAFAVSSMGILRGAKFSLGLSLGNSLVDVVGDVASANGASLWGAADSTGAAGATGSGAAAGCVFHGESSVLGSALK